MWQAFDDGKACEKCSRELSIERKGHNVGAQQQETRKAHAARQEPAQKHRPLRHHSQ